MAYISKGYPCVWISKLAANLLPTELVFQLQHG